MMKLFGYPEKSFFPSFVHSQKNMDPLSFNLMNQTKLIWTAFFIYVILSKKQSMPQIGAIFIMMFCAFLISYKSGEPPTDDDNFDFNLAVYHGIVPNLGAALISGVHYTYHEFAVTICSRHTFWYRSCGCSFPESSPGCQPKQLPFYHGALLLPGMALSSTELK